MAKKDKTAAKRKPEQMEKHLQFYRQKTSINLVVKEKSNIPIGQALPLIVLILLLSAVFSKFLVVDRLLAASQMQRQARDAEAQLMQLQEYNRDFEAVRSEYNRFFSSVESSTIVVADVLGVLDILEGYLYPAGTVSYVSFLSDTMDVDLYHVDLDGASELIGRLNALPSIGGVSLSRALSEGSDAQYGQPVIHLTITFQGGEGA